MKVVTVVQVNENTEQRGVFPSWPSLVAFYRAKPRLLLGTVVLVTLVNLAWVIDHLT